MIKFLGKHAAVAFGAGAGKAAMDHAVKGVFGLANRSQTAGPPISGKHALALGGSYEDKFTKFRSKAFKAPYEIRGGNAYTIGEPDSLRATIRRNWRGQWQWVIYDEAMRPTKSLGHGSEDSFHDAAEAIDRKLRK